MGPLTTASGSLPTVATRTVNPGYFCLLLANLHLAEAANAHDVTYSHSIPYCLVCLPDTCPSFDSLVYFQQRHPVPFQESAVYQLLFPLHSFDSDSIPVNAM